MREFSRTFPVISIKQLLFHKTRDWPVFNNMGDWSWHSFCPTYITKAFASGKIHTLWWFPWRWKRFYRHALRELPDNSKPHAKMHTLPILCVLARLNIVVGILSQPVFTDFHLYKDRSLHYEFEVDRVFSTRSLLECVISCRRTTGCVYGQYDNHQCRLPQMDYVIMDMKNKEGSIVYVMSEFCICFSKNHFLNAWNTSEELGSEPKLFHCYSVRVKSETSILKYICFRFKVKNVLWSVFHFVGRYADLTMIFHFFLILLGPPSCFHASLTINFIPYFSIFSHFNLHIFTPNSFHPLFRWCLDSGIEGNSTRGKVHLRLMDPNVTCVPRRETKNRPNRHRPLQGRRS